MTSRHNGAQHLFFEILSTLVRYSGSEIDFKKTW